MDATIANSSDQTQRTQAKSGQRGIQIARNEFFAGLFLLGCANGIAARGIATVHDNGWLNAAIGVVALALIALPLGGLSWIAVTGLALYILLFTDSDQSTRRGAVILLATTVPMVWSRLLFRLFANFILEIDASLVGWLLG